MNSTYQSNRHSRSNKFSFKFIMLQNVGCYLLPWSMLAAEITSVFFPTAGRHPAITVESVSLNQEGNTNRPITHFLNADSTPLKIIPSLSTHTTCIFAPRITTWNKSNAFFTFLTLKRIESTAINGLTSTSSACKLPTWVHELSSGVHKCG